MNLLNELSYRGVGLGTTPTTAISLVNLTSAAAGAQQYSPALLWEGSGWKTNATAASQTVDFRAYVVPIQGTAAPAGVLTFESSIDGGAFAGQVTINTAGRVAVGNAAIVSTAWLTLPGSSQSTIATASGNMRLTATDIELEAGTSRFITMQSTTHIFRWLGATRMYNDADGVLGLRDNAGTGFTGINLGGTTSSYPQIRRSGAGINLRLADNSADAALTVGTIKITGGSPGLGKVLTSDADGDATWETAGAGSYSYTIVNVTTTSSSPAQTSGDIIILVDAATAGGNVTINLPTAVGNGAKFTIKKIDSGANTVTVDASSTQTIDGDLTQVINFQNTAISLVSNNANWFMI